MAVRVMNALLSAGYSTLAEARKAGPTELMTVKNLGSKGLLAVFGLYGDHAGERPLSQSTAVRIVTLATVAPSVDHRELLRKYLAHVIDCTGLDLIDTGGRERLLSEQTFSDEDIEEIRRLIAEYEGTLPTGPRKR